MNFLNDKDFTARQGSRSPCSLSTEVILPTTFLASDALGESTPLLSFNEKDLAAGPSDVSGMEKQVLERRRSSKDLMEQYLGAVDPTFDGQDDVHSYADLLFSDSDDDPNFPLGYNDFFDKENDGHVKNELPTIDDGRVRKNSLEMLSVDEKMMSSGYRGPQEHTPVGITPTQTAPLSQEALGYHVPLSKPIFEENGLFVCGTQQPVNLTRGSSSTDEGYYAIVSRLINTTGSPHSTDKGIFSEIPQFHPDTNKYSCYVSNVFPVPGAVRDMKWTSMTSVAIASGKTLSLVPLDAYIGNHRGSSLSPQNNAEVDLFKYNDIHTDDIRAIHVVSGKTNNRKANLMIASGGFDGTMVVSKIRASGMKTQMSKYNGKNEVVGSVCSHKERENVVSFTEDSGNLKLYDVRSNKVVLTYNSRQSGMFTHAYDGSNKVVCGFEKNRPQHHSMEFVELRMVRKGYEAGLMCDKRDRHMDAVGNICVSKLDSRRSRYIVFGNPGFSVWDGFVQVDYTDLTCSSTNAEVISTNPTAELDGDLIPFSHGNAIGATDQDGNFNVYNIPRSSPYRNTPRVDPLADVFF